MNAPPTSRRASRTSGFSMIEVIIAVVILAVGILGLGGATAYIVRQVTLADIMTERAAALQSVVERIQSMDFDTVDAGSDSVGMFAVNWSLASGTSETKLLQIVTVGPGVHTPAGSQAPMLARNVADTFQYRVIRP